jgi:hypothetical protein
MGTYCCRGQTDSKLSGTWIHFKTTVGNKIMDNDIPPDTIIIGNGTFEQRVWMKNEAPFSQTGEMTLKKGKIEITKRTTSTSNKYGSPPDIYYRYKLKNQTLIIENAATLGNAIEDHSIKLLYRRLENK